MEQTAQRSCENPIPEGTEDQVGWGTGQPGHIAGNPVHGRRAGTRWSNSLHVCCFQFSLLFYQRTSLLGFSLLTNVFVDSLAILHIPCKVQFRPCLGFLDSVSTCLDSISVLFSGHVSLLPLPLRSLFLSQFGQQALVQLCRVSCLLNFLCRGDGELLCSLKNILEVLLAILHSFAHKDSLLGDLIQLLVKQMALHSCKIQGPYFSLCIRFICCIFQKAGRKVWWATCSWSPQMSKPRLA